MNKVLLAYKKSGFDFYSNSPDKHTREFTASDNEYSKELEKEHHENKKAIEIVEDILRKNKVNYDTTHRCAIDNFQDYDLVISLGGDGTVFDVSHNTDKIPILGVNSTPSSSVGFLCHCNYKEFEDVWKNLENIPKTKTHRMKISINNKPIKEHALNDVLFAHPNPSAMTKYNLKGERFESSGLLVSTPVGSTAFIHKTGGFAIPIHEPSLEYINRATRKNTVHKTKSLEFECLTREAYLWIDGEYLTYPLTLGDQVKLEIGDQIEIYGDLQKKQNLFVEKNP